MSNISFEDLQTNLDQLAMFLSVLCLFCVSPLRASQSASFLSSFYLPYTHQRTQIYIRKLENSN